MSAITEGPKIAALSCGKPVYLVVLLHGPGSSGQAVIDIALNWAPTMPKADFVALEAPLPAPDGTGRQWFDEGDGTPGAALASLDAAAPALDILLDEMLAKRRLDDSHLALVGFSQGAMLALHAALRRPKTMAAVVGFAGTAFGLPARAAEIVSRPQVLLIHGEADDKMPYADMLAAKAALKDAGVPIKSMKRPGLGHGHDDDGIVVAGDYLTHIFGEIQKAKAAEKAAAKAAAGHADHDDHDHDDHDHAHEAHDHSH